MIKKSIIKIDLAIYKQLCRFCTWLQLQLYDDYTWQELDMLRIDNKRKIEELQDEVDYYYYRYNIMKYENEW